MIHIEKEPPETKAQFHNQLEHCFLCGKKTEWWHIESNTPVCPDCAETHDVKDLPHTFPE